MKNRQRQKDTLFSILIFCSAFAVNLLIQKLFTTQTLVPMIFVFGVFLISLKTHGYCYGITSAIVSVFAVNFAFTYPYYVFDFFVGESILSAVIMLAVAVFTSTLNSRIRDQEKLRAESEKERMRSNLLRAISHDLRTPLTSIYGSSSTLISKYDALPKIMIENKISFCRWRFFIMFLLYGTATLLYRRNGNASRFLTGGYCAALVSLPNLHRRNAMM